MLALVQLVGELVLRLVVVLALLVLSHLLVLFCIPLGEQDVGGVSLRRWVNYLFHLPHIHLNLNPKRKGATKLDD